MSGQTVTQAPELLEGLTWQQIAGNLSSSGTYQAQAILGDANYLTAAICEITGNRPGSVCGTSTITGLENQLAQPGHASSTPRRGTVVGRAHDPRNWQ